MIFTSAKPYVICLMSDRESLREIADQTAQILPDYELVTGLRAEEGLKTLDRLVAESQEIALFIADQDLVDIPGGQSLIRSYERWPHAMRVLVAGAERLPAEGTLEAARLHRIFYKPMDWADYRAALREVARFYNQRLELLFKSRVLTELHRASMTLIGERNLDKLLHKLMRIVIEKADAVNGYIILARESDGALCIEAEGHVGAYETTIRSTEVNDFSPVCPAIVEYARKTSDNVILSDAMNEGLFAKHPFIRKMGCRSLLCTPLIYQGMIHGLLYLENNLKPDAFSAYHIELFRLLSAPAAIAIQNARFYGELEQKVSERTREVMSQKAEIERVRDEIQDKNNDIIASIQYAKRIQDAILPKLTDIRSVYPNSFIYFRPKDIVSGDFYWFSRRLSKSILACGDCTGHGVPGAFMNVMANTLLKQIVELEGIFKPNEILYQLHLRTRVALQQEHSQNTNKDGLDIALCQLDVKRNKLQFAGANRSLLLIRDNEIIEMKGDRYGIGGDQEEEVRNYTNHSFEVLEGDSVYIFSDGFADQIGHELNKKYLMKRFYQFLLDIHTKDMEHQTMLLDAELRHWGGDREQTDDITVIGIRF